MKTGQSVSLILNVNCGSRRADAGNQQRAKRRLKALFFAAMRQTFAVHGPWERSNVGATIPLWPPNRR
jgi:hypothetical protein